MIYFNTSSFPPAILAGSCGYYLFKKLDFTSDLPLDIKMGVLEKIAEIEAEVWTKFG